MWVIIFWDRIFLCCVKRKSYLLIKLLPFTVNSFWLNTRIGGSVTH